MPASVVIREAPPDVVQQATEILESHHEHLLEAKILWLVSNGKATSQGEVLAGKGKKLPPEVRFLSSAMHLMHANSAHASPSVDEGYDFVITVYESQWKALLDTQRKALLDHLLCYCDRKERRNHRTGAISYSWAIRGPDVREFTEIVERHGLWRPAIKRMVDAGSKQLGLPLEQPALRKPRRRRTSVDESSVVVETQIEDMADVELEGEEARSAEQAMADHYAEDEQLRADFAEILDNADAPEVHADDDLEDVTTESADIASEDLPERSNGHNVVDWRTRTRIGEGVSGDGRSRDERIADLEAREAALDQAQG